MLTKNGGLTLRFGPPAPKRSMTPTIRVKTSKLSIVVQRASYNHLKALDETNRLQMNDNALFSIVLEIFTENTTTRTAILFSALFVKILVVEYCEYHRSGFLPNSFRMRIRWALYDNFELSTLIYGSLTFWGPGTKTQRRAAIFGQRVSGMTGHLIFACQPARSKKLFLGHPNTYTW